MLLAALIFAGGASLAFADVGSDAPAAFDSARPEVGAWIGFVSWNDPVVSYAWFINPDGTFSSGRAGRGDDGGGTWGAHGRLLILKYADGFRYEGELHDDVYGGTAYLATGRVFGGFSMRRAMKSAGDGGDYGE